MKKPILLLTLLLSVAASTFAVEVEINGLWYEVITKGYVAKVIQYKNDKYSGNIVIPKTVEYEGVTCAVTSIGEYAFRSSKVTSVTIPNSVITIEQCAFLGCLELNSVTIPNSVTKLEYGVFSGCQRLTSISIPNSITSIGEGVFAACSGLTSVTIPNSVTSLGKCAFQECSGLTTVTIPSSVTNMDKWAFYRCNALTSVHISDLEAWCKIAFTDYASNPLHYAHHLFLNGEEIKELVIPNSVTHIGKHLFRGCSELTSVTIPNNVKTIGDAAFEGCSGLPSFTIPNSVTNIGHSAFKDCSGMTSIVIPNSVTAIGDYAFSGCSSFSTITIGNRVETISSFAFSNCSELTDVYCLAENVPSMKNNKGNSCTDAFEGSYIEYATLHVPDSSVNAYKQVEPWKNFKSIVGLGGTTPTTPKCDTPTISFVNGELEFSCETEGVEYEYEVTVADAKKDKGKKVSLTGIYKVSVFATKAGYEDSDVATMEFSMGDTGLKGDMNGDGVVDTQDAIKIIRIYLKKE